MDDFYKFFLDEQERINKERSLTAVNVKDFDGYFEEILKQTTNAYYQKDDLDKYYDYEVEEPKRSDTFEIIVSVLYGLFPVLIMITIIVVCLILL